MFPLDGWTAVLISRGWAGPTGPFVRDWTALRLIVEVYVPACAFAGMFTHQPTGWAAVLPPMVICPRPVAAAVS